MRFRGDGPAELGREPGGAPTLLALLSGVLPDIDPRPLYGTFVDASSVGGRGV